MSIEADELALVRRALEGDPGAFVTLCEAHRNRLWRVIASIAPAPDREDLAQEAIVRAYRSLNSYRGDAAFAAWLCRIAVNAAHDYQRSAWRRRTAPWAQLGEVVHDSKNAPHELAERSEMQRRVRQAVASLPEKQRIAVWLHYFEGFSMAEVSRLERTSESTVRSRIQAGLKRLALPLHDFLSTTECVSVPSGPPKGCEI